MRSNYTSPLLWLSLAGSLALLPAGWCHAQSAPAKSLPAQDTAAKPGSGAKAPSTPDAGATQSIPSVADRAKAYFHAAMAGIYENQAFSTGEPAYVRHAIEEYKAALDADPGSAELNDELADLYYRTDRMSDAQALVTNLLKKDPNDVDAHRLLGRIYLRQLSENQNGVSSNSPAGNALDKAIGEFEKIVELQPGNVQDRMVLGQLYNVKHEPKKAEAQFQAAQAIEPDSEDVVLNLARIYADSGNLKQAAQVIESVPESERTPRMEFALGATYNQLKEPKQAIAAFQRASDMDPGDLRTLNALARALLDNGQLDEALKQYQALAKADPQNADAFIHISEIQRRQGKYQDALTTIRKAIAIDPKSLEAGYNEGLLLDVLGQFQQATAVYQHMVDLTSHANGAYTPQEKNNRGIFLDRLGAIYHEQNKTDLAIAAYQKLIAMGGDQALRGYQGEIDTYRDAKEYDKVIAVAQQAVAAYPKNLDVKLMLAGELADLGKPEEGINLAKGQLDKSPSDNRAVWLSLAQMYIRLHRWKDAEQAIKKAEPLCTKKDDRVSLLFVQGELAERQKHYGPAESYFRQVLDLDPSNAMTLNYLGYMLADKGIKLPEALQLIRKAVSLDPMNAAYLDSLGWTYYKLGQYDLAEENLRQAVARDQTDPTVRMHLGDLYEKTGRIRLAAAQWQLSLQEFAKSLPSDIEPGDVAKVQKKLESARVKIAKEESIIGGPKSE